MIDALMSGNFVAKAELIEWPGLSVLARVMNIIPIERAKLRRLPDVVDAVTARLRAGQTVVAFPEGTTWCGLAYGPFRPAIFQAAIDAGRPVQPLRLSYHHRDGRPSTTPAFVGDDTLVSSFLRIVIGARDRRTGARRGAAASRRPPARPGPALPRGRVGQLGATFGACTGRLSGRPGVEPPDG